MSPQVAVPEAEARAGLTLKPRTFPLEVKDGPVMDVAFVQFLASVSGKVSCLGKMLIYGKNRSFQGERWVEVGFGERLLPGQHWGRWWLLAVALASLCCI